jgi:hypothetical protein
VGCVMNYVDDIPVVIGFLVLLLLLSLLAPSNIVFGFLLLLFASMLILQPVQIQQVVNLFKI